MQIAGLGAREVLGLVREARAGAEHAGPVVVRGVLAAELARALRGGDDAGGAIRVDGDPTAAAALVVSLGGAPTAADEEALRRASRGTVPVVAVQTDPGYHEPLAYVTAGAVVTCQPGQGFPVDEIVRTLVEQLGPGAVSLAARVPALREHVVAGLIRRASTRAAVLGALPWRTGADFPVLTLLQGRLVLDIAAAYGREVDRERAPELLAVAGSGLGARALVRRLPRRVPLLGAVSGYAVTRALGLAASRRFAAGD